MGKTETIKNEFLKNELEGNNRQFSKIKYFWEKINKDVLDTINFM